MLVGLFYLQMSEKWRDLRTLRLKGCGVAIATTCVLWGMVHISHIADEVRFGEPLPSGWEHSSSFYWYRYLTKTETLEMHFTLTSHRTENFCWSFWWKVHLHILFLSEVMMWSLHWSLERNTLRAAHWDAEDNKISRLQCKLHIITSLRNKIWRWTFHQNDQQKFSVLWDVRVKCISKVSVLVRYLYQ